MLFWLSDQLTCRLENVTATSVKECAVEKKIILEVKLPKVVTVALYAIAIAFPINVFKPVVTAHPAFAELNNGGTFTIPTKFKVTMPGTRSGCN